MPKAVIYARYSCDKQSEQSIEDQIHVIRDYAEHEGYTIVNSYIDRAKSAKTDNRPQFLQMIADSSKHVFDIVLVYKLDRFSRNRYDSAVYKARLKKNGVKVVSATENLSDNPESIITEAMLEAMAEFYSAELGQKTRRGMRESALKCQTTGAVPPLGYKWGEDKKLHIDESTAEIPQIVFKMYASGSGKQEIASVLNAKGFRTRRGQHFTLNSFDNMLTNRKYIGVYCYNEDIEVSGGCPALINTDIFKAVQEKVAQTKKAPARARAKVEYYLAGKIFCGYCGEKMIAVGGTSRTGAQHHYYKCNNKQQKCEKKAERKDFFEWLVAEQAVSLLNLDEHKEKLAAKVAAAFEKTMQTSDLKSLEAKIKAIDCKINGIIDMLLERKTDALLEKMDNLELQRSELQEELTTAKIASTHIPSEKEILKWFAQIEKLELCSEETQEFILQTFVNKVYVWNDKAVIALNLPGTQTAVTFEEIRKYEALADDGGSFKSEFGSRYWT